MIKQRIIQAETRWPQLQFNRKTSDEASAACPWCGGEDRFLIFADGGYWCRQCQVKGWLDEGQEEIDPTERRLRLLEAKQRQMEARQQEQERRLSALERMSRCTDHLAYHQKLTMEALEYWWSQGMTNASIDKYKLGYCDRCPTDRDGRASYTIPVYDRDGASLINIRHRLIGGCGGDKYRPHLAGLGAQLFNARFSRIPTSFIIITEGEKKSIILDQEGFANVGIMGQRSFRKEWIHWLEPFGVIYVALDPDAAESACRLARLFESKGRVVHLPVKADDFFVQYHGSGDDFKYFLAQASYA